MNQILLPQSVTWTILLLAGAIMAFGQAAKSTNPIPPSLSTTTNYPSVSVGEGKSHPASAEDIRKLLSLTMDETTLKAVMSQIVDQLRKTTSADAHEFWARFEKEINTKTMVDLAIPIYAKHFSHDEVIGLIRFYESPVGLSHLRKSPKVTADIFSVFGSWGIKVGERILNDLTNTPSSWPSKGVTRTTNQTSSSSVVRLSSEQKRQIYERHQVSEEEYELRIDGDNYNLVPRPPKPAKQEPVSIDLPESVRYVIQTESFPHFYYSEKEPKSYGTGFRFVSWPQNVEMTLNGNVVITKIRGN